MIFKAESFYTLWQTITTQSRFLLLCHKIFNLTKVKQFVCMLLFAIISKYQ